MESRPSLFQQAVEPLNRLPSIFPWCHISFFYSFSLLSSLALDLGPYNVLCLITMQPFIHSA